QRVGNRRDVVWSDANSARVIDDFFESSYIRGDYREARVERLSEYDRQSFQTGIRLTIDVGGGKHAGHVGALSGKADSIGDSELGCLALERLQKSDFTRPLSAAHHPADPAGDIAQLCQRLQMNALPFPRFQS